MIEVKDEILTGEPRYRLKDNNGNIVMDNLSIEQITPVVQEGTPLNKLTFDTIQNDIYNFINSKGYVIGSYTGNGASRRIIELDFSPSAIIVFKAKLGNGTAYAIGNGQFGLATHTNPAKSVYSEQEYTLIKIVENGFEIYYYMGGIPQITYQDTNTNGMIYNYIAFK